MYIQNFKLLALFRECTAWFVLDLVINPNCWFSHAQAQIVHSVELNVEAGNWLGTANSTDCASMLIIGNIILIGNI